MFLIALAPLLELRFAIPVGLTFGMSLYEAFGLGVAGNLLQVPLIYLSLQWAYGNAINRFPIVRKWLEKPLEISHRHEHIVQKYGPLGLAILVFVPLPGTGIWTASLLAVIMRLGFVKSCVAVGLGVLLSGIFVALLSYGVISIF